MTAETGGGPKAATPRARRTLRPFESALAYLTVTLILLLVLAPHAGLLLLSFSTIWSFSPLPDGYTTAHYIRIFGESSLYINNTLIYASLAGLIDVVLGTAIADGFSASIECSAGPWRSKRDNRARYSRTTSSDVVSPRVSAA